jgi:ketosteroid isomerase-like protein
MKYSIILFFVFVSFSIYSQEKEEGEIRKLEEMESNAVVKKDTATLLKLWAKDYTVNAPSNRVVTSGKNTLDRPVINQANYASFIREIEHVIVKGETAIVMGNETVTTAPTDTKPSIIIKRRYSNIWMKQTGSWKLVARHANVICSDKP